LLRHSVTFWGVDQEKLSLAVESTGMILKKVVGGGVIKWCLFYGDCEQCCYHDDCLAAMNRA
jgi:hypothetical protein